jgi:hypothetical protein
MKLIVSRPAQADLERLHSFLADTHPAAAGRAPGVDPCFDLTLPANDIAELDCRWSAVKAGEATVPNEDVVRWLRTWGTPSFKSLREY